ncbi:uncharacterized protein LOC130621810 [Hydractinia symbiolongicarpus]|uniref:uncharacterized protein LOC130621810 n=1 Tax=Hydractinia symbiolongicarpus TaxID=13093 RepID=UPI00254D22A6|nr:uncharacterized protein LOC130621810 [Hydractinia symbiolongicarpus]
MDRTFTLFFVCIVLCFNNSHAGNLGERTCDPSDHCSCKWSDTGKIVSLWGIDGHNSIKFKDKGFQGSDYQLDYNPCTPFTEEKQGAQEKGCIDCLSCQHNTDKSLYYSAGTAKGFSTKFDGSNLNFLYAGDPTPDKYIRYTKVKLICDPKASEPQMSQPIETKEPDQSSSTFSFTLTSECACDGACKQSSKNPGNVSVGTILVILFFVLLFVYFVGGFLFLKFYKHNEGTETIPQYEFWKDLPAKIKDGFIFTKDKIKGNKGEYEAI